MPKETKSPEETDKPAPTGAELLEYLRRGGSGVSEEYLDEVEAADRNDKPPDDPWAEED